MKWFKHDAMSVYDTKLRVLGGKLGAAGLGVYWGLLAYICFHGDSFQVKILGITRDSVRDFEEPYGDSERTGEVFEEVQQISEEIPSVAIRDLSKTLFCTQRLLLRTIEVCIEEKLFDLPKWKKFDVLYSSGLAKSQDEYTKKRERNRERVRTLSGQPPENLALQQEQDVQQEEEIQNKRQKKTRNKNALVDLLKSAFDGKKLSTPNPQDDLVPMVSDQDISQFREVVIDDIRAWNQTEGVPFPWNPKKLEICRLLRGGDPEHKLRLCYEAMNLLDGDATYPRVVRRAVHMMLEASRRNQIENPFGWLWTCLHGNADGTTPWVQLTTTSEES